MQIPKNFLDQKFTENGKVAELRKTMTMFKNLLNSDILLNRGNPWKSERCYPLFYKSKLYKNR